jgi:hypothetical protein|tara:strand:+ start:1481 stop:1900 length:420 start_codon:yes stop_codon:yes gene_type:complete
MSTIKQVAEHAKAELVKANDAKKSTLDTAVVKLKAETAQRDSEQEDLMVANAKAIAELESNMDAETEAYVKGAADVISALTANEDAGVDSVSEVVAALIAADDELDNSMLKWGADAEEREGEMIEEIGETVDVSAGGES